VPHRSREPLLGLKIPILFFRPAHIFIFISVFSVLIIDFYSEYDILLNSQGNRKKERKMDQYTIGMQGFEEAREGAYTHSSEALSIVKADFPNTKTLEAVAELERDTMGLSWHGVNADSVGVVESFKASLTKAIEIAQEEGNYSDDLQNELEGITEAVMDMEYYARGDF
jgi:hypothetical protein